MSRLLSSLHRAVWCGLRIRALLVLSLAAMAPLALAQPTVFVVRHAERQELPKEDPNAKDPELSAVGAARAARLADVLAGTKLSAIYVTPFKRTELTAAPVAKQMGLTPRIVAASETKALLSRVTSHPAAENVLVVGHSNTVPLILAALGVTERVVLGEGDYGDLFVVVPRPGMESALVRLKF